MTLCHQARSSPCSEVISLLLLGDCVVPKLKCVQEMRGDKETDSKFFYRSFEVYFYLFGVNTVALEASSKKCTQKYPFCSFITKNKVLIQGFICPHKSFFVMRAWIRGQRGRQQNTICDRRGKQSCFPIKG